MSDEPIIFRMPDNASNPGPFCARCGCDLAAIPLQQGWRTCPGCGLGQKPDQFAQHPPMPSQQGPLSAAHFEEIEAAKKRAKKLRKAASVASFSAWTTGFFAFTALVGGLFGPLMGDSILSSATFIGVAMSIITINEFRGAAKLRRAELSGPILLGFNQLGLLAAICVYCLWNMFFTPKMTAQSSGDPHVDELLAGFSGLETTATFLLYGAVIIGTLLAQGFTAMYYFTRRRIIQDYLDQTPAWVVELNRRAA